MLVGYRIFRGTFASCERLFQEAAAFATQVGRERLISISHSEGQHEGVVTVWYWGEPDPLSVLDELAESSEPQPRGFEVIVKDTPRP
jgi:hypothetical protein